jgi:hypothetical protein
MGKSNKLLGYLEDRSNRDCAERTLKMQPILELEAGIPYFQVMIMNPDGLISEPMETVFHWR